MQWSYGVTTVPSRRNTTLPVTLKSLDNAGFPRPVLFIDGPNWGYTAFSMLTTYSRDYSVGTVGNWILAAWSLYLRDPLADLYAVFQDDLIACKNLREYLESIPYLDNGYWNLYTFPHNQPEQLSVRVENGQFTHAEIMPGVKGFYRSCQWGKGAVALVFNRQAITSLLSNRILVNKPQDRVIGTKGIDGAICDSMKSMGITEYVHNPSLVQHIGEVSSMGNPRHEQAISFPGEGFDAMELLSSSHSFGVPVGQGAT